MRLSFLMPTCVALALGMPAVGDEIANPLQDSQAWHDLEYDIIGDLAPADGSALFDLEAPYRAEDASTVPVNITQTDDSVGPVTSLTLVIDENPAPVAATITFGDAMAPLHFETRVRVDQYSNIRMIAETGDGSYMTGRFVKASGGCSAPASRDPAQALAGMGEMRLRLYDSAPQQSGIRREAQIMIRHPNYSGLQRDQITQLFVPAHFIDRFEVWQGTDMLFTLDGGISISENPAFRFEYTDNGAAFFHVRAEDTEGNVFEQDLPKPGAS